MATYQKGPLGRFSGTLGPVVGSKWKKLNVMHSQPGPRTGDPTAAQLDQQAKFGLALNFANDVKKLIKTTIPDNDRQTSFNTLVQQLLNEAITGSSNAYSIDYSKVTLTMGELENAYGFSVASAAAGKISWTWQTGSGVPEDPTDRAVLVAYCEDLGRVAYKLSGAARQDTTDFLTIPLFSGKVVETWLSFISANGKEIAESVHTGQVTVQ
ncbi:MAG: hypothetical protein JST39_01585 [Bacteroidetes bacterium]|nr:hypothetical protein [Bacteroidota bacterium]